MPPAPSEWQYSRKSYAECVCGLSEKEYCTTPRDVRGNSWVLRRSPIADATEAPAATVLRKLRRFTDGNPPKPDPMAFDRAAPASQKLPHRRRFLLAQRSTGPSGPGAARCSPNGKPWPRHGLLRGWTQVAAVI